MKGLQLCVYESGARNIVPFPMQVNACHRDIEPVNTTTNTFINFFNHAYSEHNCKNHPSVESLANFPMMQHLEACLLSSECGQLLC